MRGRRVAISDGDGASRSRMNSSTRRPPGGAAAKTAEHRIDRYWCVMTRPFKGRLAAPPVTVIGRREGVQGGARWRQRHTRLIEQCGLCRPWCRSGRIGSSTCRRTPHPAAIGTPAPSTTPLLCGRAEGISEQLLQCCEAFLRLGGAVVLPLVEAGYVDAEQLTSEEADACVEYTGKRGS